MTERKLQRPPAETPVLYGQDGKGYDAIVFAHYFIGNSDWLVTEYDPIDGLVFGWACVGGDREMAEFGYTSLLELETIGVPLQVQTNSGPIVIGRVHVEYDEDWEPRPLREAVAELDRRHGR